MIILAGASATLVLGIAIVLLLRTLFIARIDVSEVIGSWRDYRPLGRLLAPTDFDYLRRRGIDNRTIRKFRVERRKIYRMCLRSLVRDFNQMHARLTAMVVQSGDDRPELVAELARQRATFFYNVAQVEFRLFLHACGFETMPAINLLQPVEILQTRLRRMASAGAAA